MTHNESSTKRSIPIDDALTAAYASGFERGMMYIMEQLQKFLEENENVRNNG